MRALFVLLLLAWPALAQSGFIADQIEGYLSTDDRIVRFEGAEGFLGSSPSAAAITVADRSGVWLRIEDAEIVWNRTALFSRRLEIVRITASRVVLSRAPDAPEAAVELPSAEAAPPVALPQVPELPVSLQIAALALPRVEVGAPLIGEAAALSVEGALALEDGALDTTLALARTDGPGGAFRAALRSENATRALDLDLDFREPRGGIVAGLLGIEGRPPLSLQVAGGGTRDDLEVQVSFAADGREAMTGRVALTGAAAGATAFDVALAGDLSPVLPPVALEFLGPDARLTATGRRAADGALTVDALEARAARLSLTGALALAADGVPLSADITGDLGGATPTRLPGTEVTVGAGILRVRFGDGAWTAQLAAEAVTTPALSLGAADLTLEGTASDLTDPRARRIAGLVRGRVSGIAAADPALAEALGEALALDAGFVSAAGAPLRLEEAAFEGGGARATLTGALDGGTFRGAAALRLPDLTRYAALVGRPLAGAARLSAEGEVEAAAGAFDLTVDGETEALRVGALDALLAGTSEVSGQVRRDGRGLTVSGLRLGNDRLRLTADGTLGGPGTRATARLDLSDIGLVAAGAAGRARATVALSGLIGRTAVEAEIALADARVLDRPLTGFALGLSGWSGDGGFYGDLTGQGALGPAPIRLAAALDLSEAPRIDGLALEIGEARLTGDLAMVEGLLEGELDLDAAELRDALALALIDGSGQARGTLRLTADGGQGVALDADLLDLTAPGVALGRAALRADIADLLGRPAVDATLTAEAAAVAGLEVAELSARAETVGDETALTADIAFARGATLAAEGSVIQGDALAVRLTRLRLAEAGREARLTAPATLTAQDGLALDALALEVGAGRLTAAGRIGEVLDLSVTAEALPLDIANAVLPALEVTGLVGGEVQVRGPRAAPDASFDLRASGVGAAALAALGLPPLDVAAEGTADAAGAALRAEVSGTGLSARAEGQVPFGDGPLDATARIDGLPLAVFGPALGVDLAGMLSGELDATGTLAAPEGALRLVAERASVAGIGGFGAEIEVTATPAGLRIDAARLDGPLSASASGTVPLDGGDLAVQVVLERAPLGLANAVAPALALAGTVEGTASLSGRLAAPDVAFDLSGSGLGAAPLRAAGLGPLAARLAGRLADRALLIDRAEVAGTGLSATAAGRVPLTGRAMDLEGRATLALATLGRGVQGTVAADLRVQGPLTDPRVTVAAEASGLGLDAVRLAPLSATARASFADGALTLEAAEATGPYGLRLTASGRLPLAGAGQVTVAGQVPLALARTELAASGIDVAGTAALDATVSGSLTAPRIAASATVAGAVIVLPGVNIRLEEVAAQLRLEGDALRLTADALNATGGTAQVAGTIGLGPGLPADLRLDLANFAYSDGRLIATTVEGTVTVTGLLTGGGLIQGGLRLGETNIAVAAAGGGVSSRVLPVRHVGLGPAAAETLARAGLAGAGDAAPGGAGAGALRLDLTIAAPNRIFVRGRGLDAEFSGRLEIGGTVADLVPVGGFDLVRGRIDILGQRLTLTRGRVQLVGTFDPVLDIAAETAITDGTAIVALTGPASDLSLELTSDPELPGEEILAEVLFRRPLSDLSPLQLVQLAAAVAELTGDGSGGVVGRIRRRTGLDDIDITTDEEGETRLRVGAYLADNVYSTVETGADGESEVTINIDITPSLTARGSVDSDGESSIGIFFEKDY